MSILDVTKVCYQTSDTWALVFRGCSGAALVVVLACCVARWLRGSSAAACTCYWGAVLGGLLMLGIATAGSVALRDDLAAGRALLVIWTSGAAAVLLARVALVVLSHCALRRSRPVDDRAVASVFQRVAGELQVARSGQRPVEVRVSATRGRPAPRVFCFWRTRVLLPAEALGASIAELRIWAFDVLALARTRRLWCRGLATAASALWWFHPLVWYALQQFARQQRRAADALAVSCGASADDYAQFVWDHHRAPWLGHWVAAARRLLSRRDPCELRVLALVGESAGCCHYGLARALIAASLLLGVTGVTASLVMLGSISPALTHVANAPARKATAAKRASAHGDLARRRVTRQTVTASQPRDPAPQKAFAPALDARYGLEREVFERWSRLGRAPYVGDNIAAVAPDSATADLAGRVNER